MDRCLPVVVATMDDNSYIGDYSLSNLQRLADGNIDFTIEMLQIYLENADKDFSGLKESCRDNDLELTGALAHKLIPANQYLHLISLVIILKDIEINAKMSQDSKALTQLVEQAVNAYSRVRPIIISDLNKLKLDKIFNQTITI